MYTENKFLKQYLDNNFFDICTLINSVAHNYDDNYIYFGDLKTNSFYISDNLKERFGFKNNIVKDLLKEWEKLIYNPNDLEMFKKDMLEVMNKKKNLHDLRYRIIDKDGNKFWIRCQGKILWNKDKTEPLFFSGIITSPENDFVVDPITKFPMEAFAISKLKSYVNKELNVRIVGFSINHFSEINEIYGKEKGDMLLRDITKTLDDFFDKEISFFRLDGLRFAAVIAPTCIKDEEAVIRQIKKVILDKYKEHNIADELQCSFSYMNILPGEMNAQDIISNTIVLINVAKASPDPNFVAHTVKDINDQKEYAKMLFKLREDINNNFRNFRLVIQPIVRADNHKIKGGEILLRWKCGGKDISPAVFIPILEESKLINIVGKWILENAIKNTKKFLKKNAKLQISSNVSYIQILEDDFIDYVRETINKSDIDPSRMILELTETNFDNYPEKLAEFFKLCTKLGVNVALDDFGSGYSSIGLLLKYPTNIVKLDKSIVDTLIESRDNEKFIISIINACHIFGKQVCAEGVETKETLNMITNAGCDVIQGFYFSKPVEIEDYLKML